MAEDPKAQQARAAILNLVEAEPDRVFYLRQLEVMFEGRFFHWITSRAANELWQDGSVGTQVVPFRSAPDNDEGRRLRFVFNRRLRYHRRAAKRSVDIVEEYAESSFAKACGDQAEMLFLTAFAERGFLCHGRNMRSFRGATWTATEHDLDYIVERDGVPWGVEVKNTWDYIDRTEMRIKVRMCRALGIRPLFIVRAAPKSYVFDVRNAGGFTLVFATRIYPFGHQEHVKKVQALGMPAVVTTAIPSGIMDRFEQYGHQPKTLGPEGE